jgi:hypothetical protein
VVDIVVVCVEVVEVAAVVIDMVSTVTVAVGKYIREVVAELPIDALFERNRVLVNGRVVELDVERYNCVTLALEK